MKKIVSAGLLAATLISSASAELLTFEFDTSAYMGGTNVTTTAQSFTLGFKIDDALRAGILQENGSMSLTQGAVTSPASYTATALNLEYSAYSKEVLDAIIGLNLGSLNSQGAVAGTSTIAPGSYIMTDIYAKVNYNATKNAFLDLKLGYRMLDIADTGATPAFDNQNTPFLKVGLGVKF